MESSWTSFGIREMSRMQELTFRPTIPDDPESRVEDSTPCTLEVDPTVNYMVGGMMRTGTSMMMDIMRAVGFSVVFNPGRQATIDENSDEHYNPNPGGLYELSAALMSRPKFPWMHRGKFVKTLGTLSTLYRNPEGGYKIIYMRRDPYASADSQLRFFGKPNQHPDLIANTVDLTLRHFDNRRDVQFLEVWYRKFIDHPWAHLRVIQAFLGVEFDVLKGLPVVDRDLCRSKREELPEGVWE